MSLFAGLRGGGTAGGKAHQLQNRDKHAALPEAFEKAASLPQTSVLASTGCEVVAPGSGQALLQPLQEDVFGQVDADKNHLA
jgi:hypothetical protein